jgi:hypothetical protein
MAIQASCPYCRSETAVDESRAGQDIVCPHCQNHFTAPSVTAGRPAARPDAIMPAWGDDLDGGERGERGPRWSAPHYPEDDERMPRDASRWNATVTGLGLMFWGMLVAAVLAVIMVVAGLLMSTDPRVFMIGPGGQPPPELLAFGFLMLGLGCAFVVLGIILIVGMCMCCTAPPESGARGKAIGALVLIGVGILGLCVFFGAVGLAGINQARQFGGAPAPGQLPFDPALYLAGIAAGSLVQVLVVALWMLFHKRIADYFGNRRLAQLSVWFIPCFAVYAVGAQLLQFVANPQLMQGNLLAPEPTWTRIAQMWALVWVVGLSIWLLYIFRETRRTILEDDSESLERV